jgi:predicted RNase H-like HicB family nuclease
MNQKPEFNIEQFGEDGWFFMTSPQLPGFCIFGATLQEVKCRVKGTAELALKAEAERIEASMIKQPAKTAWHSVPAEDLVAA